MFSHGSGRSPWNLSFQDLEIFDGRDGTNEKVEEVEAGRAGRKDDGWTASPTDGEEGSRSPEAPGLVIDKCTN